MTSTQVIKIKNKPILMSGSKTGSRNQLIKWPCGDGIAQLIRPLAHRTDKSILKTTRTPVTYFLERRWLRAARLAKGGEGDTGYQQFQNLAVLRVNGTPPYTRGSSQCSTCVSLFTLAVIPQVLVDDINTGYQQFQNLAVLRVNGSPLLNLAHLKELITNCKEDYVRLDLEDDRIIMLDKGLADAATERVRLR